MVVDIINKTLDTTAIVKIPILTSPIELLYPYFDGHFYEKLGTSIILEKSRSIRNTNLFYL
jgi:hypothetical protein